MRPPSSFPLPAFALLLLFLSVLPAALPAQSNPFTSGGGSPGAEPSRPAGFLVRMQKNLHERLSAAMVALKEDPAPLRLSAVAAAAFAYGFIHSLGPGHRKTVLAGLFAGRSYRTRDALYAGMGFAFLHGGSAVVLVLLIYLISAGPVSAGMDRAGSILETGSFAVLAVIGIYMTAAAALKLAREKKEGRAPGRGRGKGITAAVVFGAGLVPCPGAALVLSFSIAYRVLPFGVLAVAAMSLGMGTALTIVALGARSAGAMLKTAGTSSRLAGTVPHILEMAGGAIIALFALAMLFSPRLF